MSTVAWAFWLGWAGLVLLLLLLLLIVLVATRLWVVSSRKGSFPAWLFDQEKSRWVRGMAIYGRTNLEWRPLWGISARPNVVLERQNIDVVKVPEAWDGTDLLMMQVEVSGTSYSVALSPGDASGLISWIDSSPPSGQIRS